MTAFKIYYQTKLIYHLYILSPLFFGVYYYAKYRVGHRVVVIGIVFRPASTYVALNYSKGVSKSYPERIFVLIQVHVSK